MDELKTGLQTNYVNEYNQNHFDSALIKIGYSTGVEIDEFVEDDGNPCPFWEFCKKKLRNKRHALKLYLLTTKIKSADVSSRTESSSVSSTHQNLFDRDNEYDSTIF